jgi:hypothetical protein
MLSTGFADASLRLMKPKLPNKRSNNSDSPQGASPTGDTETASVGADSSAESSAENSADSSADSSDTDSDTDSDSDSEDTTTDAELDSSDSDSDDSDSDDDDTSEATSDTTTSTASSTTASTTGSSTADPVPAELLKGVHLTLPSEKMAALLAARGSAQKQAVEHEQAAQAAATASASAAAFAAGERKRFFVSLMDERIYKVGVFKRLRPRQRVKVRLYDLNIVYYYKCSF